MTPLNCLPHFGFNAGDSEISIGLKERLVGQHLEKPISKGFSAIPEKVMK